METALIEELFKYGVPQIIQEELACQWGPDDLKGPVEEGRVDFSYLFPEHKRDGVLLMRFKGCDSIGEKMFTVAYTDHGVLKERVLRVMGQEECFKGPIPQDPAQTRAFVEALNEALNNPRRQPVPVV